ncbi:MAG: hypothetical protein HY220_03720 [Candidatus Sungbacteria bacterium]|uniref:Uncharacterized protein n=1 Tax=Candidatus Sungiibacteriota bacterium TaxID=2750080 RepID=A0A9D6QSA2_9BACT|nr:hypothetical protein [Candidatus Sungbacteria bacterium]
MEDDALDILLVPQGLVDQHCAQEKRPNLDEPLQGNGLVIIALRFVDLHTVEQTGSLQLGDTVPEPSHLCATVENVIFISAEITVERKTAMLAGRIGFKCPARFAETIRIMSFHGLHLLKERI